MALKGEFVFYPAFLIVGHFPLLSSRKVPTLENVGDQLILLPFGSSFIFLPLQSLIQSSLLPGVLIGDTVSHALYPLKKLMVRVYPNLF